MGKIEIICNLNWLLFFYNNFISDKSFALGYGQFGLVFRGKLKKPGETEETPVAVKTLKPYADKDYVRALLREIKVMIYFGKHPHILELIGCCTIKLEECEPFANIKRIQPHIIANLNSLHEISFR